MRVAELSELSEVTVASIKFYAREGLLQGNRVGYNQTEYGPEHVVRLRLIRALINTAGLSIASVRQVLEAVDNPDISIAEAQSRAQTAVTPQVPDPDTDSAAAARKLFGELQWSVADDSTGFRQTAAVLRQYEQVGRPDLSARAFRYAGPVLEIAKGDMEVVSDENEDRGAMAHTVVIGSILGDSMLAALRLAAREHLSRPEGPAT